MTANATATRETGMYPPAGLHPDVPFPEYLRWKLPSQSSLKSGRASALHMRAALDKEGEKPPTDAMLCGSALHCCFLEPEAMPERVSLWSEGTRRGKVWDEYKAANGHKIILTNGFYARMQGMVKSLRKHPAIREWVGKIEAVECSAVGEVEGVLCKGRCDALTSSPLFDIKATRSADPATFTKTLLSFGYHIQAHIYRTLFDRERFVFACVEMTPPHDVVCYELSPAFLRYGKEEAVRMLGMYAECAAANKWPGRSEKIVEIEPPEYLTQTTGVTLGGVAFDGDEEGDDF